MAGKLPDNEKPPVAATTEGMPKTVEAIDNRLIAHDGRTGNRIVAYRAASGATWTYGGKRARVLAMLARRADGITQHRYFAVAYAAGRHDPRDAA